MEGLISGLNKMFDSRIRLGIMSILSVNDSADFTTMKQLMGLTDGNLATHLRALETAGYVASSKQFIGRKPNTSYSITSEGRREFKAHLGALEQLLAQPDAARFTASKPIPGTIPAPTSASAELDSTAAGSATGPASGGAPEAAPAPAESAPAATIAPASTFASGPASAPAPAPDAAPDAALASAPASGAVPGVQPAAAQDSPKPRRRIKFRFTR